MDANRTATAGAVHDFNNALQSIGASLNLIERRVPDDGAVAIGGLLKSARDQLTHARSLVQRIFLEACPVEERIDLHAFLDDMAPTIEAVMGDGITLDLRADGVPQPVMCDPSRLKSALLNMALNARDAMDGSGTLTISVRQVELDGRSVEDKTGLFVEVVVTDTGEGMEEAFASHAFEPFVTTKAAGHGTGLGLFQLRSFVESSRGFVQLTSRKGAGTSVAVFLPLAA